VDLLAQPVGANWTSYNGDYPGRRYSSLREIKPESVAQLRVAWVFHPGNSETLEATPVVVNGTMYATSANDAFALDARTGRVVWRHQRPVSSGLLDDAAAHHSRGVSLAS
jgi:alcohol dehydrogenase (cytochrome c)